MGDIPERLLVFVIRAAQCGLGWLGENFGGRGEKTDSGLYMNEYCDNMYTWRSILVRSPGSEEGPKNPLKGISMKSLVFACYAQFRVDAGG